MQKIFTGTSLRKKNWSKIQMKTKEVPTGAVKMRQITESQKGLSQKETLGIIWPNPSVKANSY